jgi:hypothetical protein
MDFPFIKQINTYVTSEKRRGQAATDQRKLKRTQSDNQAAEKLPDIFFAFTTLYKP